MYNVTINTQTNNHNFNVHDLTAFLESLQKGDVLWTPDQAIGFWLPFNTVTSMLIKQVTEGENTHRDTALSDETLPVTANEATQDETPHEEAM